jgi:hypothetical protein
VRGVCAGRCVAWNRARGCLRGPAGNVATAPLRSNGCCVARNGTAGNRPPGNPAVATQRVYTPRLCARPNCAAFGFTEFIENSLTVFHCH